MPYGIYYAALQDAQGNSLAGQSATVTVRYTNEGGALAQALYADRQGAQALDNPYQTELGQVLLYAPGGVYHVHVQIGALEIELPHQQIGLGAESDITLYAPKGDWGDDPASYDTGHVVTSYGSKARLFASLIDANVGNAPPDADESDAFWMWLPSLQGVPGSAFVAATSESSVSIGLGEKVFETQLNRGWEAGVRLRAASGANPGRDYMEGTAQYSGTTLTLDVDLTGPNAVAGPHIDWTINLAGERGSQGADGVDPGYLFNWETGTSAPPSAGAIRANNADLSAATEIYVSDTTRGGSDVSALIQALAPGGKSVPNGVSLTTPGSLAQAGFTVTGVTDEAGYTTLAVSGHAVETAFAAGAISLQREFSGEDGEDGLGTGDMQEATYDPAEIAQQVVGLTAAQTVSGKTFKDYGETVNACGSIGGGMQDIDIEFGNVVSATVDTGETTFTFSNPPAAGTEGGFKLYLTNGGSQTVNWPASVVWSSGSEPTLTPSGIDILVFSTIDGGTSWFGFASGLDMS